MSDKNRVAVIAATICAGVTLGVVGSSTAGAGQPLRPVSYINPDTGAATANPDVDPASKCATPDQSDTQTVGNEATGAGNVHNDACLLDGLGANVDAQVAFQSAGVGVISACPDPDGAGPKTATNSTDRKLCVQSGFETGGANGTAGDGEYHIRLVSATPGTQTVTFCADPEGDGCANATTTSTITVTWVAATVVTTTTTVAPTTTTVVPTTTTVAPTTSSPRSTTLPLPLPVTLPATGTSTTSQALVGLALVLAGGSLLVVRRRRIA
ncbi:MAG: LPXTG cell wall anchor domain-containing protein [Ilumatobacteraceae bacterium]